MSDKKTYIANALLFLREYEGTDKDPYIQPGSTVFLEDERALKMMEIGAVTPKYNFDDFEVVTDPDTGIVSINKKEKGKVTNGA